MTEQFLRLMTSTSFEDVRAAWIARARVEAARTAEAREWLVAYGYSELSKDEELEIIKSGTQEFLPGGRTVLRAQGKVWAMDSALWEQKKEEALSRAKLLNNVNKPQIYEQQSQCAVLIDGQLCGGSLVMTPICPMCSLGKSGVSATLTCDTCGCVTAIMVKKNG